jgi:YD repeat-containing protein
MPVQALICQGDRQHLLNHNTSILKRILKIPTFPSIKRGQKVLSRRFLDGQPLETHYEYNNKGGVTKVIDEAGREASFIYNDLNQLILSIAPSDDGVNQGAVTSRSYDNVGRLVKITKANGGEWSYGYNSLGLVVWEEDPLGHRKSYEYDLNGNVIKKTDAKGQVTLYLYDSLNRLTNVNTSDGEWAEITYCEVSEESMESFSYTIFPSFQ